MGIRGELFSTRFACDGRTYFFNVKQNRNGDVFLSIVESKPSEGESYDRRSIVVFGEHMEEFLKNFQTAIKYMDKTGFKVDTGRPSQHEEHPRSERSSGFREQRPEKSEQGKEYVLRSRPERPRSDSDEGRTSYTPRSASGPRSASASRAPSSSRYASAPRGRAPGRKSETDSPRQERSSSAPLKRIVVRKTKKPGSSD